MDQVTPVREPSTIIFGGTFDPPHFAHVGCVQKLLDRFPKAQVLVMPSPNPPVSAGVAKAPQANFQHRLAMAHLAFGPLGPRVEVSSLEETLHSPNYTIQTLTALAQTQGDQFQVPNPIGLCMGQDQLQAFPRWYQPLLVLQKASLIVVARGEPPSKFKADSADLRQSLKQCVEKAAQALGLGLSWHQDQGAYRLWTELHGVASSQEVGTVFLLPGDLGNASSSEIRQHLTPPSDVTDHLDIPPLVLAYIRQHQLYRPLSEDHL